MFRRMRLGPSLKISDPDDWPPFRTLADLATRHWNLRVACHTAEHRREAVFGGAQLWWRFHRRGKSIILTDIAGKLRCSRCWGAARSRGQLVLTKTRDAPTVTLPDPDIGEWKRLVSRTRN